MSTSSYAKVSTTATTDFCSSSSSTGGLQQRHRSETSNHNNNSSSNNNMSSGYRDYPLDRDDDDDGADSFGNKGEHGMYRDDDPRDRGYRDYREDDDGIPTTMTIMPPPDVFDPSEQPPPPPRAEDVRTWAMGGRSNTYNNNNGNVTTIDGQYGARRSCWAFWYSRCCDGGDNGLFPSSNNKRRPTTNTTIIIAITLALALILGLCIGIPKSKQRHAAAAAADDNNNYAMGTGPLSGFTFVSQREADIVMYLTNVSSISALNNTKSPQRRAARWLALNDTLNLPIPNNETATLQQQPPQYATVPLLQRYAILVLYYSLNGPLWDDEQGQAMGWLTPTTHECSWKKLSPTTTGDDSDNNNNQQRSGSGTTTAPVTTTTTTTTTTVVGVLCDRRKQVTGLVLPGINSYHHSAMLLDETFALLPTLQQVNLEQNNIYGPLPSSLSQLTSLQTLLLANNRLGAAPSSSSAVDRRALLPPATIFPANVKILDLSHNSFAGTIHETWNNFGRLKQLYLSNNVLSGRLPQTMRSWTSLQVLALDGNHLTGTLDVLKDHYQLAYLYLENNELVGSLTNFFKGGYRRKLTTLDISNNQLTGPIPTHILQLSTLKVLDAHRNRFQGTLPKLTTVSPMEYLALQENLLSGQIPFSWGNMKQLSHLDISDNNQMGGVLPDTLMDLTNLQYLFASNYKLDVLYSETVNSALPDVLSSLTSLRELSLDGANLMGTLPSWLGQELTNLYYLNLSNNQLNGSIPTNLSNLTHLKFLLLSRNDLVGTVPTQLGLLHGLQALSVDLNAGINGSITKTHAICKSLRHLQYFSANCGDVNDNCPQCSKTIPQITCTCCTKCCKDAHDESCLNQNGYVMDKDDWRLGYNQSIQYKFPNDKIVILNLNR